MRLHPFAAAGAAALLCAALVSCSGDDDPLDADPVNADVAPEPEQESAAPSDTVEEEVTALGWAGHPGEVDGEEHPGVTGGADGETVTASDADDLAEHLSSDEPLTVEVDGTVDLDGTLEVGSDKTLVAGENGAELTGGRLVLDGADNVVLDGLRVDADGTALALRGGSHHVWVDGSTFSGSDDGPLVTVDDGSDYVTLSWNHFSDAESALAVGGEDDEPGALRVSIHHNFFDGTAGAQPRARNAEHVHVFNNYFRGNAEYGVLSAHGSLVLVEGNYFEDTAMSVSSGDEDPGNVVTRDNLLVDTEQPELRGDVPDPPYAYEVDDTVDVPDLVTNGAGRGSAVRP
ncbi:polysaccharide lyase family 1 protein [Nocardiopsis sp. NRRL B-16309]|uniref:pectate lyase family protein n=1 Tax=Nocardiopsis sp. NRRL B-16309 TaxID=1519494 RepID=UPI0006AEA5C9|nr:right-handed parallel beta-helix repeat-containing protein [Nocardiopsis sp. NRRL B-16309]KOX24207.1 pectate lyase [Nocardiopsis sp. NRRL B-16309]